ncbi:MAG: hypothetical protein JRJ73_16925, partial [Deltaproteobacteria bacterium]|nr:hypothetical protein [Deltaproteobacteria bacterium]
MKKKKTDAEIEATKEIWDAAEAHYKEELAKKTIEFEAKAEASNAIGFFQKMDMDRKYNDLLTYVKLYQLKKDKTYLKLGMTWEGFCESIG